MSFSIELQLRNLRKIQELTLEQFADQIQISEDKIRSYETNSIIPPADTLIKIAAFYGISIDFLLLWDKTEYCRSNKFLRLSEKIDKLDQLKRFQIETTTNTLLKNVNSIDQKIREDNTNSILTTSFYENFKVLRKSKNLSLQAVADKIGVTSGQIYFYERKSHPRVDGLIKLSELFDVSIHAMLTGEKLSYNFKDQHLEETMLKADKLLSLKDKEFLIHLMEKIIETSE